MTTGQSKIGEIKKRMNKRELSPLVGNWDNPGFLQFFHMPQRPATIKTRIDP
jgi:hypothetical protein